MRFTDRVLDEYLEEKVMMYFLCYMSAEKVVPVCSGRNYIDVFIQWKDGDKLLLRCFPGFKNDISRGNITGIGSKVDVLKMATILGANGGIGYVFDDKVDIVWETSSTRESESMVFEKVA